MRRALPGLVASSSLLLAVSGALGATLTAGVVPSTQKVRPDDQPATTASASLRAARNEFEAFQIVLRASGGDVAQVSAKVSGPLVGPLGAQVPAANVVLYAERYYDVGTPSNDEGAAGLWPDPLVPDVDTYFGETRNAFPLTVPDGKTRVVWVDVLVPIAQAPGDYAGSVEIDVAGAGQATIPLALHVGTFTLPSTASLTSAFGMGWNTPPLVHCGGAFPYCNGDLDASNAIRALYLRAALEHRVTISSTDFQPPFGGDQAPYEKYVLPLVNGTAPTRLVGAQLTSVVLDGSNWSQWISYAKSKGFFDRLFAYPIDEPGTNASQWSSFTSASDSLHAADATARICLTTSMQDAQAHSAVSKIDIFVPVLDEMWGRPGSGYAGDQRASYDAWLGATSSARRSLWMYQSCDQHGCGACGDPSPGADYVGWPSRVIDSSGVQDRAFEWWSFLERTSGELYFETTYQLATAWDSNGQCAFSGSGDGTIFYPGKPSVIGGTKDIPLESIRLKLIREGMEDYEYLTQVAATDPALARSVALGLFPTPFDCHKSPAELETARGRLYDALDHPVVATDAGTSGPDAGATDAGGDAGGGVGAPDGGAGPSAEVKGGCGCGAADAQSLGLALVGLLVAATRRSRSARLGR
jgi:hypothetical protein